LEWDKTACRFVFSYWTWTWTCLFWRGLGLARLRWTWTWTWTWLLLDLLQVCCFLRRSREGLNSITLTSSIRPNSQCP